MSAFSLYERPRKSGKPVFYVQFKKPDGSYTSALSTGCISRKKAEEWAEEYLKTAGQSFPAKTSPFVNMQKVFLTSTAVGRYLSELKAVKFQKGNAERKTAISLHTPCPSLAITDLLKSKRQH